MVTGHEPAGEDRPGAPSRRSFLTGAGATAIAGLGVAACSSDASTSEPSEATESAEVGQGPTRPPGSPTPVATGAGDEAAAIPFARIHQAGPLLAPAAAGLVAAFDVVAIGRAALIETMQVLSTEIERLMTARPAPPSDEFLPPIDSGAVGDETSTAGVAITVAVGASLFDDRFELAERRPAELIAMPRFFNDRFVRDDSSHGDLAITISGPTRQLVAYALHQVVRMTERRLRLRWVQEGYNTLLPEAVGSLAPARNLMGFRDGTSNLDTSDEAVMNEHVWIKPGDDEPEWAVGGTYQAVRVIRMLIEFWATAALVRQEQIFGRHRSSGAPLGQSDEGELPAFAVDPSDETVPRRSHMRLANPRTPGTARILRRGFSYLNGAAVDGTLDQGLVFMCFQRSLRRGFLEVQARLDGEPLEDYIKPVGGGLYFVLPGPGSDGAWLGASLLE